MWPEWEYFHFLRPWWGLLFLPLALALWWMSRRQQEGDMFGGIIAPHLLEHLRVGRFRSRWFNPRTLSIVITVFLAIIMMGPSWRQEPSPLSQDEAALVILLDVSASMEQVDIQPSRLARARQKISDLLDLRLDKRAALIVYAGSAHTVLNLTADREILGQYLAALQPGIMPRPGKFPEYALPAVDRVLRDSEAPATLVMFTDGLGADSERAFTDWFKTRSHQLLVVGVGSDRSADSGSGLIPLEREALQALASGTGGYYQTLTVDDSDMRRLDRRIDNHFVILEDSALPWLDSGYPLVFVCLLLCLPWFRRGWTLTWAWLLLPLLLLGPPQATMAQEETATGGASRWDASRWFASLWLTPDQQGRLLLGRSEYRAAAARFADPLWKGIALYYAEDFMAAAEYFSRSDSDDALFNEANARAQARDYLRAVQRYDALLARTPDYPGAAENRQRVQALIDEINRLSESQQQEAGVGSEEREMGGDQAVPAEGAEMLDFTEVELKQLSADDILGNPATADMWMRAVQQDPSDFLAIKFSMQLEQANGSEEEP
ncbi:MAG: VWA domain-containing protein [Pseudomonadota bacterium]